MHFNVIIVFKYFGQEPKLSSNLFSRYEKKMAIIILYARITYVYMHWYAFIKLLALVCISDYLKTVILDFYKKKIQSGLKHMDVNTLMCYR